MTPEYQEELSRYYTEIQYSDYMMYNPYTHYIVTGTYWQSADCVIQFRKSGISFWKDKKMISQEFVSKMENTRMWAKRFFLSRPESETSDELIKMASFVGMFDNDDIDEDLFKHLMKKYRAMGIPNE